MEEKGIHPRLICSIAVSVNVVKKDRTITIAFEVFRIWLLYLLFLRVGSFLDIVLSANS